MRNNHLILLIAAVAVLVAGIMVFRFEPERPAGDTQTRETGELTVPESSADANSPPSPVQDDSQSEIVIQRPELEVQKNTAPPVIVDSFIPSRQTELDGWSRLEVSAGHFDVVTRPDGASVAGGVISSRALVSARGWAGDLGLGMRLADVLLSRCGKVVARARVSLDRPDVAEAVHNNLLRSGWEAQIFAGDLPVCGDDNLSAWAVIPGQPALLAPLIGTHAVVVALGGESLEVAHVSAQADLNPDNYPAPPPRSIQVLASRANLRRCGSTGCAVVGQVDRGVFTGLLLERRETWSLIAIEENAGWIFNELYRVVE